jgi:UTP--glucose-1-phosphate uridylyltransferase
LIDTSEKYGACTVGVQTVSPEMISKYCSLDVKKVEDGVYDVNDIIEKPLPNEIMSLYAILGRYVLNAEIMDILGSLPAGFGGEIQLTDALRSYCHMNRMLAVDFEGRRYDCGNMCGYMEAVIDFALDCPETSEKTLAYLKKKLAGEVASESGETKYNPR